MNEPTVTFEGQPLATRQGQSVAAALTEAGHLHLRDTPKDAQRGMFCGMGVCQDCLVTVDGTPNVRACMTMVAPGMEITRQTAFPPLSGHSVPTLDPLELSPDVLIIGGGAGGLSAAIAAAKAGASVVVLDERKVSGGQYFKQSADGSILDTQQRDGAKLVMEAIETGAQILNGVELWGAFDPLLFFAQQGDTPIIARPKSAIIATGAFERPVMVPGWTLPGVMTTGAAQTLWRSYGTLPGKRVAICGSGPLNAQVALELAKGGAQVVRLAESAAHPVTRPILAAGLLSADPALTAKGLRMELGLRRLGVPIRNTCELIRVDKDGDALAATFRSGDIEDVVTVDALCMNAGFEPQNEILRLLGAEMRYDLAMGHLRCQTDADMRTKVAGLFAVGDCKGLGGAPAAQVEGAIAGAHAAAEAGHGDAYDMFASRRALTKHRKFQARLWQLYDIAPRPVAGMDGDTMICRCEEVAARDVRGTVAGSTPNAGALKRATRLGMGRCQGRYCGPVAARMVSEATGTPIEDLSFFAPRVPIKPVAISALLGSEGALDDE